MEQQPKSNFKYRIALKESLIQNCCERGAEQLYEKINPNQRNKLLEKQDIKYREFHKSLCTTSKYNMIGVRTPETKKIANEFNIEDIESYIFDKDIKYYEEVLLRGFLIVNKKNNLEAVFKYLKYFIPMIDNWAICDGTCASLKITKKHEDEMWDFLQNYIVSSKEFEIRFALVMYLNYYTNTKYLKEILGKKVNKDLEKGTPFRLKFLKVD